MEQKTPFNRLPARERISAVVETWFLTEPLFFAAWTMHDVVENHQVQTMRVTCGRVEFNPDFVVSMRRDQLRSVLAFEAMRILLGHPYERRQPDAELSYSASNLTVQECLRTALPIPRPRDLFGGPEFDEQYFEFYYRELAERSEASEPPESEGGSPEQQDDSTEPDESSSSETGVEPPDPNGRAEEHGREEPQPAGESKSRSPNQEGSGGPLDAEAADADGGGSNLDAYADPRVVGRENAGDWESDDLLRDEIHAAVREAAEADGWGTVGATAKEQLLASLNPKLDYRGVLRGFRQSVLAVRRRLTRMKPSRRYGFAQMGSRYDFTTKLLFAVDVSGSMGSRDLQLGFSVVSRFFRYGIESIDVVWFDDQVRCEPMTLRRARREFQISGRGGTSFVPVLNWIDRHTDYDGLIIFTDGYAPVPPRPTNTRTRILWLFKDESTYLQMNASLRHLGRTAFLQADARSKSAAPV